MSALRQASLVEIPARDGDYNVIARDLTNSEGLRSGFRGNGLSVFPTHGNRLAVAVVCPDWDRGWGSISDDEWVSDQVGSFFHFARQYVLRSQIASVLGSLLIVYGRGCDFYGSWVVMRRNSESARPSEDAVTRVMEERGSAAGPEDGGRTRSLHYWIREINALDPFVHRAVFQLVRATRLSEASFSEEAVTALDGLSSVAAQFAQHRMGVDASSRADLAALFSLSHHDGKILEHLYQMRCDFGAHPGWSKWWDFSEIYEEDLPRQFDASKRLLMKLIQVENDLRVVEPCRLSWSKWFNNHACVVYDAVWCHKIK